MRKSAKQNAEVMRLRHTHIRKLNSKPENPIFTGMFLIRNAFAKK